MPSSVVTFTNSQSRPPIPLSQVMGSIAVTFIGRLLPADGACAGKIPSLLNVRARLRLPHPTRTSEIGVVMEIGD
jgi:hypothetical protein